MRITTHCVRCFAKKLHMVVGHVLLGKEKILAGWCRKCLDRQGFRGHYRPEMGAKLDQDEVLK